MLSRWHKGQSAAEIALAAPALALLSLAVADVARVFCSSIAVAKAARAGVQHGVHNYTTGIDNTGMQNAALEDGQNISGLEATASE